ncbi:hypothetical protein [Metapseudomonas otitidis]|uniref:hypothetical protein n=1 Tax=Metapseudomonas otitidis TaxID=319939 RepID=UPI0013F5CF4D|nr:hypothetical protein [Pseudomonas otitidis]
MFTAIKDIYDAFPDHSVAVTPRPDGKWLLSMCRNDRLELTRTFDGEAVFCKRRMHALIRDVALEMASLARRST